MNEIVMRREELNALRDLCYIFKKEYVKVTVIPGGGIGYTMYGEVDTEVNGIRGMFKVEITGPNEW